jgi:hypothetical protein
MNPIKTREQFAHQVQHTLDDLLDLRDAVEYDEEFMGDALTFLDPLESGLRQLKAELDAGDYQPGGGSNLPFIGLLENVDARLLPFRHMLLWINEVHRDGLPEAG